MFQDPRITKKNNTVRGLSIASLVFTILCLLTLVSFLASGNQVQQILNDNKSAITANINSSQSTTDAYLAQTLLDANISNQKNNVDTASIANALASSSNKNVAEFASLINMATNNDTKGVSDFLQNHTSAQLIEMKNAVQNLTDADIQTLVSTLGANSTITTDQIKQLRDTAATVPDSSITLLGRYTGTEGSDNLAQDSITVFMGLYYAFVISLLIVNLFVLAACILGIVYSRKPKKNTVAFVFAIISAVLCFFEFAWVRMVLFIIAAVNMRGARNMTARLDSGANGMGGGQTAGGVGSSNGFGVGAGGTTYGANGGMGASAGGAGTAGGAGGTGASNGTYGANNAQNAPHNGAGANPNPNSGNPSVFTNVN